jgi:hypothetical protein
VWQALRPSGTLTPVRFVAPTDGRLRLGVCAEGAALPVELRVEADGATDRVEQ